MPKVLLADDNVTIHKVVELVLPDEYELRTALNGSDALALVDKFRPDVVLADVEMPLVDGYRLCEEIKNNPATASIAVVLLAGAFEPIDEELAARSGADGYLVKPFEAAELKSKIEQVLSAPEVAVVEEEALVEEDLAFLDEELLAEGEELLKAEEVSFEEMPAEESLAEAVGLEEDIVAEEIIPERAAPRETAMPRMDAGALEDIFRETVNQRVAELFRTVDFKGLLYEAGLKDTMKDTMQDSVKNSIEGVLWEVVPELTEKLVREALTDTLASLKKQLENVLWETVPELAETIIRKEIEKIRAESA